MTRILYECKGLDGEMLKTVSLREADEFVAKHGGTKKLVEESTTSISEGYAKKGYRKPGSQT